MNGISPTSNKIFNTIQHIIRQNISRNKLIQSFRPFLYNHIQKPINLLQPHQTRASSIHPKTNLKTQIKNSPQTPTLATSQQLSPNKPFKIQPNNSIMDLLKSLNPDHVSSLFDLANSYIQGDYEVLSRVPFTYRSSFSYCVEYIRSKCGKHMNEYSKEVEEDPWPVNLKPIVLQKLKDFDNEYERRKNKERLKEMNWRIDVALSTNSLSRVLKPEIQVKLTRNTEEIIFHLTVQQFQEFRRQTASILKDIFTMEHYAFIRNLKS